MTVEVEEGVGGVSRRGGGVSLRLMSPSSGLWSEEGLALVYLPESRLPVFLNY